MQFKREKKSFKKQTGKLNVLCVAGGAVATIKLTVTLTVTAADK